MSDKNFQEFLKNLSVDEKEQEAFLMLGIILSLILFIILGISTGHVLALIL